MCAEPGLFSSLFVKCLPLPKLLLLFPGMPYLSCLPVVWSRNPLPTGQTIEGSYSSLGSPLRIHDEHRDKAKVYS